ncbi:Ras GTPase [Dictyostelium discoideum AX4]|uniref:Ras-like protein rasU n=1 Tax=Dictyostelium discoideum TaxID=44689 RepID=RASU_DICDI|nr:Ras GTPase [Dictyostelium discoideum AX4]Q55CB0.1 RecName: Full=Ras-like protein rasU; Flags: Precursor [Dictyostelium discoideum]EAL72419.1 Ras GTPase [Dictyostelium discoideum AX4]|eukprot:XP_646571.1 Ras GTPase [Dictyostelium discoideum AX4]
MSAFIYNNSNNNNSMRLCVMGDGGVGKTSITIQFISNHFVNCYDPTIEDLYRKQCLIDDQVYMLDILDTAGQDELNAIRNHWIKSCEGFILVYSVTSRSSFDQIQSFLDQIKFLKSEKVPIIMIANKSDLDDERQVTYQEGENFANRFGMSFMEVSAKYKLNIDEVFNQIAQHCVKRRCDHIYINKSIRNKNSIFKKFNQKLNNTFHSICKMI